MTIIHVHIVCDISKIPDPETMFPQEVAAVSAWKEQGLVDHLFVQSDGSRAIIILKEISKEKAKELIATLPLYPYFDMVEYVEIDKKY
jgi:hypothetical protein